MHPTLDTPSRKAHWLPLALTAQLVSATALAQDAVPTEVYFGNLHVHTKWSFDGYINRAVSEPDDAYRWAKGEPIPGFGSDEPRQIGVPLDWYAVTDHAAYMGVLPLMEDPDNPVSDHPLADDITGDDPAAAFQAYSQILTSMFDDKREDPLLGNRALKVNVWQQVIANADEHYEPGKFTTFAGFEWTSAPDWQNLHRVVIFRDTETLPETPFSTLDSPVPEDLWRWMEQQRSQGSELLAIPHNGNASDGLMFPVEESYGGSAVSSEAYAEARMRNEPLYELSQIKGTSETHPILSPNDEFGGFEIWDYTLAATATPPQHKQGGYMREALIRGVGLTRQGRINPFQYGFIGDSDTHDGAAVIEEDNYTGKFGFENAPQHRLDGPPGVNEKAAEQVRRFSSGGVAGVWALANTREAIFDAMMRKETFATSGPRLKVRLFGGFGFDADAMSGDHWVQAAYQNGVAMGGVLNQAPEGKAPVFLISAMKEASGANLDRIQIIKGWVDDDGEPHEQIYDVALSDNRHPDEHGNVPAVGNTVDVARATYTNSIGDSDLNTVWTDPDFDPALPAVYYARVLQIPTPRWSTYDAAALGRAIPEGLPATIQERAWTSPVWYTP
ncbi:DUF3604 domain-containing protein [Marinobacter mobilis]|uniref:DUF3604 domain-containing protein n=1 Tax=Marinobacter mobilis TaxID=488533 RepID=UPI0035C675CF